MALAVIQTRAKSRIHAPPVTVEVHLSNGLPSLSIVGMPEMAVKESKDQVRSALINSHFDFPAQRITVNLAPADLPKEGGRYDLAIALGILSASGQLPNEPLEQYEFTGELALSGEHRPVDAVLPTAMACAKENRALILPQDNAKKPLFLIKQRSMLPTTYSMSVPILMATYLLSVMPIHLH
jgi:magnesium chelatase family protein